MSQVGVFEERLQDLDDVELALIARRCAAVGVRDNSAGSLAEFLAVARELAVRRLGLRPFDSQLIAARSLLAGCAVELDTGEGKTLAGAIAAVGYVLSGRRVHVLSVNDYLAERDATQMRALFEAFGVQVDWIGQKTAPVARRRIYAGDVVYGSVSEVGFDVLRDRFATDEGALVAPAFDVAIIDEVDAVLIDEAMVPLVLAGTSDEAGIDLADATRFVAALDARKHFVIDAEHANASFTDAGLDRLERDLGNIDLYSAAGEATLTGLTLALHARALMRRDVDYLVEDGAVALINSSRGRVADRQRWPDGLHAAIEVKEGLSVTPAGVVLDSITVQDLAMRYSTLAGMSGTVQPVAGELEEFVKLRTTRVERHVPDVRVDAPDVICASQAESLKWVVEEVTKQHSTGRPVLVGTQTVAASERIAALLESNGVATAVLNAKNDADEAAIIARAGEFGAVTISTQMSGRGTDILLGGGRGRADRDRVVSAGGLIVILVGKFPSRRLDAQLRGRAGRQGDPGETVAVAALDDELVTTNLPEHALKRIDKSGPKLTQAQRRRLIKSAQTISEGVRLDRHRATWAYARAIAEQRAVVLEARAHATRWFDTTSTSRRRPTLTNQLRERLTTSLAHLDGVVRSEEIARFLSDVLLFTLDDHWRQHLGFLTEVRDGIHLRALAGEAPVDAFHGIALRHFGGFFDRVVDDAAVFVSGLDPKDIGRPIEDLGLRRPTATWTYLVTDDPFGSHGDRFARRMGKLWREEVLNDQE